eukprot:Clim_evm16s142 gene=Clim_evmTU16s142
MPLTVVPLRTVIAFERSLAVRAITTGASRRTVEAATTARETETAKDRRVNSVESGRNKPASSLECQKYPLLFGSKPKCHSGPIPQNLSADRNERVWPDGLREYQLEGKFIPSVTSVLSYYTADNDLRALANYRPEPMWQLELLPTPFLELQRLIDLRVCLNTKMESHLTGAPNVDTLAFNSNGEVSQRNQHVFETIGEPLWKKLKEFLDTRVSDIVAINDVVLNTEHRYGGCVELVARIDDRPRLSLFRFLMVYRQPMSTKWAVSTQEYSAQSAAYVSAINHDPRLPVTVDSVVNVWMDETVANTTVKKVARLEKPLTVVIQDDLETMEQKLQEFIPEVTPFTDWLQVRTRGGNIDFDQIFLHPAQCAVYATKLRRFRKTKKPYPGLTDLPKETTYAEKLFETGGTRYWPGAARIGKGADPGHGRRRRTRR